MKTKKLAYLLVVFSLLGVAFFAHAGEDDSRYLVKTTSNFWKKSFGVRNNFDNGFTADLSDFQLKMTKIFGVEVEPVLKLSILPDNGESLAAVSGKPSAGGTRQVPSAQITWGVKEVYNDPLLVKTSGGASGDVHVNVAILDTGIYKTHPDLERRIKDCKDFTAPKVSYADGKCDDKNGHGTHVAGIIAADGGSDGKGIYGMAPESYIFAYKVCSNSGTCWADDIAAALRSAADNGANIVNMSLGSDLPSQLITDATAYAVSKHVLVIAAGGNDGPDAGSIDYPAADANVVAVAAIDINENVPSWSSRGINSTTDHSVIEEKDMEFSAPGVNIESTWNNGGYAFLSGTSMATPFISGLAAKVWQTGSLTNPDPAVATRKVLRDLVAVDLSPAGDDDASGYGICKLKP